jgi:ATP-dependent Lon protease
MAAFRSDIHTIILPKSNLKDLDDIPTEVKDNMKFIPVKNVDEVLKRALV